jgi:hypothetical protein
VKGRSDSVREAVAPETLAPGEGGSRRKTEHVGDPVDVLCFVRFLYRMR